MKKSKNISYIILLSALILFISPIFVSAQKTLDVSFLNPSPTTVDMGEYINKLYNLGFSIAGILAVGMIVFGGIMYSASGALDKKKDAKDIILSAIWGLALLFGGYLILKTVNPQLVELENPGAGILQNLELQNCSSTTPKINPDTMQPIGTEKIPKCGYDQSPINEETGLCQCYLEDSLNAVCPGVLKPKTVNEIDVSGVKIEGNPNYIWGSGSVLENTMAVDTNPFVCARKVTIQSGFNFKIIDCDSTGVTGSSVPIIPGVPGVITYKKDCKYTWGDASSIDATANEEIKGWMWPYYPQRYSASTNGATNPYNDPSKNPGKGAICIMYAYGLPGDPNASDEEDKESKIIRATLSGLRPCTAFSDDVNLDIPLRNVGGFTYGNFKNMDERVKLSAQSLQNLVVSGKISISQITNCTTQTGMFVDPATILSEVASGNYPPVCSPSCKTRPDGCLFGGQSGNTSLSINLLNGLGVVANSVGTKVNNFTIPTFKITSLTGDAHNSQNSNHYKGIAADISIQGDINTWKGMVGYLLSASVPGVKNAFCEYIDSSGSVKYTCDGITNNNSSNRHIHIDFR